MALSKRLYDAPGFFCAALIKLHVIAPVAVLLNKACTVTMKTLPFLHMIHKHGTYGTSNVNLLIMWKNMLQRLDDSRPVFDGEYNGLKFLMFFKVAEFVIYFQHHTCKTLKVCHFKGKTLFEVIKCLVKVKSLPILVKKLFEFLWFMNFLFLSGMDNS